MPPPHALSLLLLASIALAASPLPAPVWPPIWTSAWMYVNVTGQTFTDFGTVWYDYPNLRCRLSHARCPVPLPAQDGPFSNLQCDSIFRNGSVWQVSQNSTGGFNSCCIFPIKVPPTPPDWVNATGAYVGTATVYNNLVYQWHGKEDGQPYTYQVRTAAPSLPYNLNLFPIQWLTPYATTAPSISDAVFALPPQCANAPACAFPERLRNSAVVPHAMLFMLTL